MKVSVERLGAWMVPKLAYRMVSWMVLCLEYELVKTLVERLGALTELRSVIGMVCLLVACLD